MPAEGSQLSKGMEAGRRGRHLEGNLEPRGRLGGGGGADLGGCLHYQVFTDHSTTTAGEPKGIIASGNKQGQDSVQVQESGSGRREVAQLCLH